MSATRLASRYAKSLIGLAIEKGQLEEVNNDIRSLQQAMYNRDFWLLLKSPIINTSKKLSILKKLFDGKLGTITSTFMEIVTKKHREFYLPEIVDEFIKQYQGHKGIVNAKLTTAVAVDRKLLDEIKGIVLKQTGQKEVQLSTAVDKDLLGGFILQFEDKLIDSSIAHKLDKLDKQFTKNKYIREF